MTDDGPDNWRSTRSGIAKVIILFDLLFWVGPVSVVYRMATGARSELTGDHLLLAAWALALPLLVASFVFALRVFTADGKAQGWRAAGWASGLFVGGALLIGVASAVAGN
ncbi:MAG TPA: hypothetical protein VF054_21495 [Micromonosporaceae bacterium]